MLGVNQPAANGNVISYGQLGLPQMTALFVDGLSGQNDAIGQHDTPYDLDINLNATLQQFRVPVSNPAKITSNEVKSFCARIEKPHCENRNHQTDGELEVMRQFICGISNCFNNILMGVWGNISLLSISLDKKDPVNEHVRNMDRLIQNGSLLIHSLFGYLAERRVATRHLRLVQLVQEINERIQNPEIAIDIEEIERSMEYAFRETRPSAAASGMARVLSQLLHWIDGELQTALCVTPMDDSILKRLYTINGVLIRGFDFVKQLELYAGSKAPVWRRINIKSLVAEQFKKYKRAFTNKMMMLEVSESLVPIKADRKLMQFVLEQLLINADAATIDGGQIVVSARPVGEEAPEERCVVDQACDYTVVSVSDNGVGMSKDTQSKIFQPFFVANRKSNPVGLGLAAAVSIIKQHGGYIQVKSIKGEGSTFRIYLPTSS